MAMKIEEIKNELDKLGIDYGEEKNYLKLRSIYLKAVNKNDVGTTANKGDMVILEKMRRFKEKLRSR